MKQKFEMPEGEIVEKEFPIFKTPNNHDTDFESRRTALYTPEPSLTKQEFKEEVDINTIINRFLKTGEPPPMPVPEHFMDLTGKKTYFEMQSQIAEANHAFYRLPADIRTAAQNSPEVWADQVVKAVEKKDGEAILKLGLTLDVEPQKPPKPSGGTPAPETEKKPPSGGKE